MPRRFLFAFVLAIAPAAALAEQCHGQNLIAALPAAELDALKSKAEVPFAHGNLWRATKDGKAITIAGSYHMADDRFAPMLATLTPYLQGATRLLVEAGPAEEAALATKVAQDPSLMFLTDGPSLAEQLPTAEWQSLSVALKARGMVPGLAAKMRPWLLASMLEIPACMFPLAQGVEQGLDKQLMTKAKDLNLPIAPLEPYDTILGIFAQFSPADQLAMLAQTVATDAASDDMATTLADSYFAGESRLFWEFSRHAMLTVPGMTKTEADRELALVDRAMIASRNTNWIPVLEQAAAAAGPVLAVFGALHLAGETGVLTLLDQRGWAITPLAP